MCVVVCCYHRCCSVRIIIDGIVVVNIHDVIITFVVIHIAGMRVVVLAFPWL